MAQLLVLLTGGVLILAVVRQATAPAKNVVQGVPTSLTFLPDNRTVLVTTNSVRSPGSIVTFDATAGSVKRTKHFPDAETSEPSMGVPVGLAVSADGNECVVVDSYGVVSFLDWPSGTVVNSSRVHRWKTWYRNRRMILSFRRIGAVAIAKDVPYAVTGGLGPEVALWDMNRKQEIARWPVGVEMMIDPLISEEPDVKANDIPTDPELAAWQGRGNVQSLAISRDARIVVVGFGNVGREVVVFDVATGQSTLSIPCLSQRGGAFALSPDGRTLAVHDGGTITFWDSETGTPDGTLEVPDSLIVCLSFSPDGSLLATGANDGVIRLWDVAARTELDTAHAPGYLASLRFSPAGEVLVAGTYQSFLEDRPWSGMLTCWTVIKTPGPFLMPQIPAWIKLAFVGSIVWTVLWFLALRKRIRPGRTESGPKGMGVVSGEK